MTGSVTFVLSTNYLVSASDFRNVSGHSVVFGVGVYI